jgi:hypothetical protein
MGVYHISCVLSHIKIVDLKTYIFKLRDGVINRIFFKKKSFRQFCEANQAYVKTENVLCTAFQSMIEFEKEFPELQRNILI